MTFPVRQYPLLLPHREAMEAEDLLLASGNREAAAWISRWPDWPGSCLIVHGPVACGKTHLGQVWRARSGGQLLCIKDLLARDAECLAMANEASFLDDADAVAGDSAREEALFHLYNHIVAHRRWLLLTARAAPAHWNVRLADLRSRLKSCPAVAVAAPDDSLIAALLIKQFRDRQIVVGDDVIDYLVARLERTPDAARRAVQALDSASLASRRRITVALARDIVEKL
ncbi:MAG: DnaA/Hda family protein [Bdellovibrionales bacterium]